MLRAVMGAAKRRHWTCEAVFSPVARDRVWLDELREDGIPFRFAPSVSRSDVSGLVAALLSESDEPTILHSHFTTFDIPCVLAARRRRATPVIWHVHTPHGHSLGLRARNHVKYGVLGRRVERILCVSSELADVVTKRGAPRDRVTHMPNAIDADRFRLASGTEREEARRALELRSGQQVLVHFGWDWHRKGGDLFCETVARLRDAGRDVVGVTVGSRGPAEPAAQRLGLPPELLRVHESREDVRAFYAAADVFVAPSRAEGTPYSLLEAVSSGTGVVASDIPGHGDIGRNVPACRLVPLETAALADAAATLLDRPAQQTERDARAGHDWVRQHRHLTRWTEALVELYETALTGSGAAA
ncbi:MAG: glycosyltransferase family 4 protein [Solirubrobacterales bacterium]